MSRKSLFSWLLAVLIVLGAVLIYKTYIISSKQCFCISDSDYLMGITAPCPGNATSELKVDIVDLPWYCFRDCRVEGRVCIEQSSD